MTSSTTASLRALTACWRRRSTATIAIFGVAVAIPLLFVLHTGQIWEDFFITYRFSENLAQGKGLVFTAGERVHGFTSVINTLLPALVTLVTQSDYRLPLLAYRVLSLGALLFALTCIASAIAHADSQDPASAPSPGNRPLRWIGFLFPLLAVLEIKITAFSMNGQEAGFMIGFLAPAFALSCFGWTRHWVAGGVCFAGLMYTRPDGFVYIGAIAITAFLFSAEPRRELAGALLRSIALCVVLFLPWVIFAWSYYGSPIPHTMLAKHGTVLHPNPAFGLLEPVASAIQLLPARMVGALAGIYDYQLTGDGIWPAWLHDLALLLELLAVTYWLVPTRDRLGRMASFAALIVLCYLTYASVVAYSTPWYYPPLAFMSLVALTRAAQHLPLLLRGTDIAGWQRAAGTALCALAFGYLAFVFTVSLKSLKVKQEVIDMGMRRDLGLWLREHVGDTENVYLEPIGYIGYFSQRRIDDWPGLVSPAVVRIRQDLGYPPNPWGAYLWGRVAEVLKPNWIVARPLETEQMKASPYLSANYQLRQVFNSSEKIVAAGETYGMSITYPDAVYLIYQRRN